MINYLKRNLNLIGLFSCIGFFMGVFYSVIVSIFSSVYSFKLELFGLFIIFSGMLIIIAELGKQALQNKYYTPGEIEQELNVPVFGVIPWLNQEVYDEPDIMFAIDETASFYSIAYQKAVSCLKLRAFNQNKKIFAFTSTELSKSRSTIIMNFAYSLSRTGESVVVLDADFRTPSLARELGLNMQNKGDLSGLLTSSLDRIDLFTHSIPGINNFHIIPNNITSSDPLLYLHSDTFKQLIEKLKLTYDWVFIDIPPALAVPDALMVGPYVDGMVIVTGLETDKTKLNEVFRQFNTYGLYIFGVITREFQTKKAVSSNLYIKQMISNMMSENESLITN